MKHSVNLRNGKNIYCKKHEWALRIANAHVLLLSQLVDEWAYALVGESHVVGLEVQQWN
jgi:hypothetical protein